MADVAAEVVATGVPLVLLTGGEPLEQPGCLTLAAALCAGTLGLQDLGETARVCETRIIEFLDTGNMELSQVYQSLGDFAEIAEDLLTEDR